MASKTEATAGDSLKTSRGHADSDDDSNSPITHAPLNFDPNVRLTSSLGHLHLGCVPEDLTELEEEEEYEADDGDDEGTSVTEQLNEAAAAVTSSNDVAKEYIPSVHDTADLTLHIESKLLLSVLAETIVLYLDQVSANFYYDHNHSQASTGHWQH